MQDWQSLQDVLRAQRVQASRRSLRLCPSGLEWAFTGSDLELAFELPPGAYATTVLREILTVTEADTWRERD